MGSVTLKAAVLGCGPTGLLAVHGLMNVAEATGHRIEVRVYSVKRPSGLFGCQYLHQPIPGLKLRKQKVRYSLLGDPAAYREKVYGASEDVAVSPELLEEDHFAWNIRDAYAQLWQRYEIGIMNASLGKQNWPKLDAALTEWKADLVFSSLPATVICSDKTSAACTFRSQNVWAMGDAPELGRMARIPDIVKDGSILCNGFQNDPWYRAARVFGYGTIEWPEDYAAPRGASRVAKPLDTTCACNPHVTRLGRYGKWQKGVLAHSAFEEAQAVALRALGMRAAA